MGPRWLALLVARPILAPRSLYPRDNTALFNYALLHPGSLPAVFGSVSQECSTILELSGWIPMRPTNSSIF